MSDAGYVSPYDKVTYHRWIRLMWKRTNTVHNSYFLAVVLRIWPFSSRNLSENKLADDDYVGLTKKLNLTDDLKKYTYA